MKLQEIVEKISEGKFAIWIDDKQNSQMTSDYMEEHFVCFVNSLEEGYDTCTKLHEKERSETGRANTRYRITGKKDDYVCSEDLSEEQMAQLNEKPPAPDE